MKSRIVENKPSLIRGIPLATWVKLFISLFYAVGLIGMAIPSIRPVFQMLTPFHLLLSLVFLFWFQQSWTTGFGVFCLFAFGVGYGTEVMGVHTGIPFGNYSYGPVLGPMLAEVPLMIGVNWLLLSYMAGHLFKAIANDYLASAAGAILMVGMDVIIEPVAIALDFWHWENGIIPLQNYIGWFFVAFVILFGYRKLAFVKTNQISNHLLLNLVLFFAILNLVL